MTGLKTKGALAANQAVPNSIPASQPAFARTNCHQAAAVIAFQAAWESM
jgi:hypothetical protein